MPDSHQYFLYKMKSSFKNTTNNKDKKWRGCGEVIGGGERTREQEVL
jgi:hypothetical protein